jgi:chromosome segregation ATPase
MKRFLIAVALATAPSVAFAQQQAPQQVPPPDPEILQYSINAVRDQRNRAFDEAAGAEAALAKVQSVNNQLQTMIANSKKEAADAGSRAKTAEDRATKAETALAAALDRATKAESAVSAAPAPAKEGREP